MPVPACQDGYTCSTNGVCELDEVVVTGHLCPSGTFKDFVGNSSCGLIGAMNTIVVPVIFALAFLVFVFGVVKHYFLNGDDEGSRESGRQFIFWGILGMVVLFSVWGLVNILLSTLGIAQS